MLGIRPSDLEDAAFWHPDGLPVIEAQVDVTEELGSEVNVLFRVEAPPVTIEDALAGASDEGTEEAVIPLMSEGDR